MKVILLVADDLGPENLSKVLYRGGFWGYNFLLALILTILASEGPHKLHPKNSTPKNPLKLLGDCFLAGKPGTVFSS